MGSLKKNWIQVDIYSLGVIINEVISLQEPYSSERYKHMNNNVLVNLIISGDVRPEVDASYAPQLMGLIEEVLKL